MKISDLLVKKIEDFGIEVVFGIIGAGNAAIFESLSYSRKIKIYCLHHEQSLLMAMQNYYKLNNKIAVGLVTTGGGTTNSFTGLISAWMDGIPGLVISGNESSIFSKESNKLRVWGVQGFDSKNTFKNFTNSFERITKVNQANTKIEKSLSSFKNKRFGFNWLEIPIDIQSKNLEIKYKKPNINIDYFLKPKFEYKIDKKYLNKFISLFKKSKKPLLIIGNGCRQSNSYNQLINIINSLRIPFLLTWTTIDFISSNHPLYFGKSGIYGERRSNFIVEECDLLISLGSRLSPLQIGHNIKNFATKSKIVMVDIDVIELNKFKDERDIIPIFSDVKNFLDILKKKKIEVSISNDWLLECQKLSKKYPLKEAQHISKNNTINSYDFINKLNKYTKINDIVCTDMGTALLTSYYNLKIKKNMRLLTSLALGEMGFGLPGAIGAAVSDPKKRIICLNCDGGMMFNLQELEAIKYHNLNIKIIVFSNDGYLMIKNTQKNLFNSRFIGINKKSGVSCPDFSKISKAFGISSSNIRKTGDIEKKLEKFFNTKGPALIEIHMDKNQEFTPKLSSFKNKKGEFISPRFNQMSPILEENL